MTRPEPPLEAGEAETLVGFLEHQRMTFAWKCSGLTTEQLWAPLHPTVMTLGGMMAHLARVEDFWFGECVGEADPLEPWASTEWAAEWGQRREREDLWALWEARVEAAREVLARQLPRGLDVTYPAWGGEGRASLRWVLVHMVEEYARHNGHADLLREAVDGATGE